MRTPRFQASLLFFAVLLAVVLATATSFAGNGKRKGSGKASCTMKGFKLQGKVQIVDAFPDLKVQIVDAFPDVKVQKVDAFPDECGKWQFVDAFPDFKIQLVDAFPDVKVQYVDAFPGMP